MINFKANLVNTTEIKMYIDKQNCKSYKVSFVELDTNSKADLLALKNVNKSWDSGRSLANSITRRFYDCWKNHWSKPYYFYALTRQRNKFESLDPDKILGVVEILDCSPEEVFLSFLQVDPKNNYNAFQPLYKNIGTAMINSLKKLFSNKENMTLYPNNNSVENFYKKLGFKPDTSGLWSKKL